MKQQRTLFCDRNPVFYAISQQKGIWLRRLRDLVSRNRWTRQRRDELLPCEIWGCENGLIKTGPGIDPALQRNKAVNIDLACRRLDGLLIRPGETFSFWRTVGRTSRRKGYRDGRVIQGGRLVAGTGGGLCNLGNSLYLLFLHSPLTVTEVHYHSDALAPDHGKRVPFAAGTSVCYNYIDLRVKNETDADYQLHLWCENDRLYARLLSRTPAPYAYELTEEDHHFSKEGEDYYRISKIYRLTRDRDTGAVVDKTLIRDNHSLVMFDPALIDPALLRTEPEKPPAEAAAP